jgi:hypothetical protein
MSDPIQLHTLQKMVVVDNRGKVIDSCYIVEEQSQGMLQAEGSHNQAVAKLHQVEPSLPVGELGIPAENSCQTLIGFLDDSPRSLR